jgi:H+/Cl- antiporter ClcA
MEWLFERTIELAAWVAFILGLVFFIEAAVLLVQWVRSLGSEPNVSLLTQSGQSAICFVGSALALGFLACIDRYVFDLPPDSTSD